MMTAVAIVTVATTAVSVIPTAVTTAAATTGGMTVVVTTTAAVDVMAEGAMAEDARTPPSGGRRSRRGTGCAPAAQPRRSPCGLSLLLTPRSFCS